MFAALGELEVIVHPGTSEHHPIESLMILESCQHDQVEGRAIHAFRPGNIADRPGDSELCLHPLIMSVVGLVFFNI